MEACTPGQLPYLLNTPDTGVPAMAKTLSGLDAVVASWLSSVSGAVSVGPVVFHPESAVNSSRVGFWTVDIEYVPGEPYTTYIDALQVCSGAYVEPGATPQNTISEVGVLTIILIVVALFFAGLAGYRAGYSR